MRGPSTEFRVIFSEEFRQQLRRPGFIIFTIFMVAMMLIAIPVTSLIVDLTEDDADDTGIPAEGEESFLEMVGYVDPAGILSVTEEQGWPRLYDDRAEGIEAIKQNEIDTLFVLTADYMESGKVEEYEPVGTGRNLWGSPDEWDFEGFLRYKLAEGELDTDLLWRVTDPASYQRFEVEAGGVVSDEISTTEEVGELIVPMLFVALMMMAVLSGSSALLRAVYEEKETRMVEMLVTSASPLSLMTGKLLAMWTAGLIQIAVWVTVGVFAMPAIFDRIPDGGDLTISSGLLATIALSFVLGYFLFSVLAMFIATVINSQQSAQQYTGLLSMLVGLPVWLTGLWMNVAPDHILAQVFTYFPFSAPTMLMIRNAMGDDMSVGEITASLAIVAITALVLLWITARVYRAGILLSGQQIRPRNVWTALRYAD
ncbi:MAG: ABC transporter permease [Proteobacteria bacterium]|nr:ABC transporter permease [Pseudomonadota bacterium]